jgi:hypothetical protein
MPRPKNTYPLPPELLIDDALTLERLGYPATEVSPGSIVKVICRCHRCNEAFDRIRRRITAETVCRSCAHTKDEQPATFPGKLGYEKIEKTCATCPKTFLVRRKSEHTRQCKSCIRRSYWDDKTGPSQIVNPYLLDAETLQRFGYTATSRSSKSFDKVVVKCSRCEDVFDRIRRNVTEKPECEPCTRVTMAPNPEKRAATMLSRYGVVGLPVPPNAYGTAERVLKQHLEERLGRTLIAQVPLPGGQSVDLYDPVSKIGVEYCGLFWHHETSKTPRGASYHWDKQRRCAVQNIDLITVFEDEWLNRPEQVLGILVARMGVHDRKYGARQCALKAVDMLEANTFLEKHHLRGAVNVTWGAWGLYVEELVGIATLRSHHRQEMDHLAVLDRLCFASGVIVVGGASRLNTAILDTAKNRGCKGLISWSDNRWSKGTVYERLGFTLDAELPPDYTYVLASKPRERLSKQSQMKSRTGCPTDLTEHEWAIQRGYSRIWDCGKKRWRLTL